ncbi:MAG: hypothetical protein H5T86_05015 [Armatimonadetes bacterium]|nr:hypothetical protein [Armatimonadota bacterium]
MQVRSAVVGALVLVSAALAQPPFSPDQIGKPPQLLGIALQPSQARMVYKDGREQVPSVPSAEAAAKYFAGYRPVDLPRDAKLTWVLGEEIRGRFFVYLLVRTGHQGGYEYVWPGLTYSAQVDGKPIPMELVEEIPAVRTFRHPDGWGYDLGWIRSEELVDLRPGTRIAVECPEEYSFVCQCLLVSENVRRLDMSFRAAQQRLRDGQELLARLAEVFPTLAPSVEAARAGLRPVAREAAMLARRVEDAEKRIKAGERVDVEKLLASAPAFCNDLDRAERQICDGLHDGLADVLQRLEARLNRARIDKPADFPGRDACYARDVASTYLAVARRMPSPRNLEALRKQTTYYWRANQFLTRAEKALAKAKKPTARAPATAAPELRPHTRVRVLLNGIWEMSTEGSPEEPPSGGWFAVPVPHGPLHETLGQFIALDHGLPRGQKWAWFRTRFTVPAEMAGGAIFLCFDAVFHLCEAYVNGHFVGRHIGGFDPFEFEVTRYVRPGEQAEVLCFVHDTSYTAVEKSDRPGQHCYTTAGPNYYPTSDLWGAPFLGIWQDVGRVLDGRK